MNFKKTIKKIVIGIGIFFVIMIIVAIASPSKPPADTNQPPTNQPTEQSEETSQPNQQEATQPPTTQPNEQTQTTPQPNEKESAQEELSRIIDLAKAADLIVSYEFSDSASVVYIGTTWYTQTVSFKKDFIAKIGMLKKQITGYSHFEVRDAYSNEKVGELTAFSQSIEVYK